MIRENREKVYLELKSSLKRERNFCESNQRERTLDQILNNMDNVDIYYICSDKALNSIKFFGENAVIVWDIKYWHYFEEYLMQIHNCRQFSKNIVQGISCVVSGYLSEKYKNIRDISCFLGQIRTVFGIELQSPQEYSKKVYDIIYISKLFSFFHEIGHLEYHKGDNAEIESCQEIVGMLFSAIKNKKLSYLGEWADLGREISLRILANKGFVEETILEELIADIYAIIKTVKLYKKITGANEFQTISECMIAEEYISTFQNMFSAINNAWDAHYVEMKFGFPIRKRNINTYINELAVVRNGIGNLMLVFVVQKVFCLNKKQCDFLLERIDENYIDNKDIIECFANEEFICAAIEEAFM